MGSSSKTVYETTNQAQTSELPKWQEDYIRNQIMPKATALSTAEYKPYTGQTVAGLSPLEQQVQTNLAKADFGQPQYQQASNVFSELSSMTPEQYNAMTMQNYNPYQQNVISAADTAQQNLRAQQRLQENEMISKSNAFGGSRADVYQGARQGAFETGYLQTMADLMSQGYDKAQAQTMAQLAGRGQAAGSLADTATAGNQALMQGFQGQLGAGQVARSIEQAQLQADMAEFDRAQAHPLQQLNALLAGGGAIPGGLGTVNTSGSSNQTTSGGSNVLSTLGSLGQAGASFGLFGSPAQVASLGAR
jgi:hypothetical protein